MPAQSEVVSGSANGKNEVPSEAEELPRAPEIKHLKEKFRSKDYAEAAGEARDLLSGLSADSPDLDTILFIEGVSLYYCGRHEEAQLSLDRHRADFPMSSYASRVHYFFGSNLLKRSCWRIAGHALDHFIHNFPKSELMDYALYDRATVHLALEENQECFSLIDRLEKNFFDSDMMDRAVFLKGKALRKAGKMTRSESAFIMAKNIARDKGHTKVAAHAMCKLIEISFRQGRSADSADYYDAFFLTYPMSSRALEAAAAGLPTLSELGRIMPGLNRMEDLITAMARGVSPKRLRVALRLYAKHFNEVHGPEQLLKKYRDLLTSAQGNEALRQALILARLEVMETYFGNRDSEIDVFYDEVRSRINRDTLSSCMILKVARHVARYDRNEALLWLSELLERPAIGCRDEVIVVMADLCAASEDIAQKKLGKEWFEFFLSDYGSPEFMESAVLGLARVSEQLNDRPRALHCWMEYLARSDWESARGEARRALARIRGLSD
ncbi:MAG: outer membrane protein assembly factor BamD [Verrucomicrobiaceae bacterium]|nr:outer membrane protein assembly factor BamD [Verrucomicrobiaceae bacterium]